jgi:hypothetical protein
MYLLITLRQLLKASGLEISTRTLSHYQGQDFKYGSVQPYLEGGRSLFLSLYIE